MKTIIFDMDGVLFDTERVYDEAWHLVLTAKGANDVEEIISKCRGFNEHDIAIKLEERFKGIAKGEDCVRELVETTQEIIDERGVPLKPGVFELLDYLKENNYEIGLATSTRREIVLKYLKETKLEGYFKFLTTGDMVTNGKPNPEIYLIACGNFDRDPKECIAIEDSINGIKAGINAGMKVIMVPDIVQPSKELEDKLWNKVDSLIEVKRFLENENN